MTSQNTREVSYNEFIAFTVARMITGARSSDHITPILNSLHWLPVEVRINFKVLLNTWSWINNLLDIWNPRLRNIIHKEHYDRHCIPAIKSKTYGTRAFSHFLLQHFNYGTLYTRMCKKCRKCCFIQDKTQGILFRKLLFWFLCLSSLHNVSQHRQSLLLSMLLESTCFWDFGERIALCTCTLIHYYIQRDMSKGFLFLQHLIEVLRTLERFTMQTEVRSCTRSPSDEDDNINNDKLCKCPRRQRGKRSKERKHNNTFLTYFRTYFEAMVGQTSVKAG